MKLHFEKVHKSRSIKLKEITHQSPSVLCTPPLWKITHQYPSVLCTPPFVKSPIRSHWFCVLPPVKNHPSKPIGFEYSPLWKITVFGGRLFRDGRLFRQIRYEKMKSCGRIPVSYCKIWAPSVRLASSVIPYWCSTMARTLRWLLAVGLITELQPKSWTLMPTTNSTVTIMAMKK